MVEKMNLKYSELLKIPDYHIRFVGSENILNNSVNSFSIDSRKVQQAEIFIAIQGEKFDGHQFVRNVLERGKIACIVAEDWFLSQNLSQESGNFFLVPDTTEALQRISRYYRLKFDIPVFAITGSNGKTTTKEMIFSVLSQQFNVLKNPGNLNNHIGLPLTLLTLSAEHNIAITEMGTNHWGEIKKLTEIACPDFGLITNIGPAHLEFFGSLDGVFKAKSELWSYLEKDGKAAFINADDTYLSKNIPFVKKIISYGIKNDADFLGKLIEIDDHGRATFQVGKIDIKLQIVGEHNIYNALAAFAVGTEFGIPAKNIKESLENFKPADKRMEILTVKNIRILNDCYNSNPESARKALTTLSQIKTEGKRIAILGDMFELGKLSEQEHSGIGKFAASLKNINYLLTHGKFSRLTAESAQKNGAKHTRHFVQKSELINHLKSLIRHGDLILIKGSRGMAMEEVTQAIVKTN